MAFIPSWTPEHALRAEARLHASGRFCLVAAPKKPAHPAFSLSCYRLAVHTQGQAGTCYSQSPAAMAEWIARAKSYSAFEISSRLIAWATSQVEGGGNPADGGSPTDAVVTMTSKGVGIVPDSVFPYTDDRDVLAQPPPAAILDQAKLSHLIAPVKVRSAAEIMTLIDDHKPSCNGFPCPAGLQDPGTFLDSFDGFAGGSAADSGHSILIGGYMQPGVKDEYAWLELENWWGADLYEALPPSLAKQVEGYTPSAGARSSSKWIRLDVYLRYCNATRYIEHVSATDLDGLMKGTVVQVPSFSDGFA